MLKQVHIFVSGRVQGVFFRVETRDYVRSLKHITGFVRNTRDGKVEILAEGEEIELKKVAHWARNVGSRPSRIEKIVEQWKKLDQRIHPDFRITY